MGKRRTKLDNRLKDQKETRARNTKRKVKERARRDTRNVALKAGA